MVAHGGTGRQQGKTTGQVCVCGGGGGGLLAWKVMRTEGQSSTIVPRGGPRGGWGGVEGGRGEREREQTSLKKQQLTNK